MLAHATVMAMVHGLASMDTIGRDNICFEVDYPHSDSTFPRTAEVLASLCESTKLTDEEIYKLARGNAIRLFGLERYGIDT